MLYSGMIEPINPHSAAKRLGEAIGPGGPRCRCCTGPHLRKAGPKENKGRTHKRLAFKRGDKPFWFEMGE